MVHPVSAGAVDRRGRGGTQRNHSLRPGVCGRPWPNSHSFKRKIGKINGLVPHWTSNNIGRKMQRRQFKKILQTPLFLYILCFMIPVSDSTNPHEPYRWTLSRLEDQKILSQYTGPGEPNFHVYLCDLVKTEPCLNYYPYYICPASNPGKAYCNYPGHFYCAYWGCETVASDWKVTTPDKYITSFWGNGKYCKPPIRDVSWGIVNLGNCTGISLKVKRMEDDKWLGGQLWGIRLREQGADRGGHFIIKKERIPPDSIPVGPNPILNSKNLEYKPSPTNTVQFGETKTGIESNKEFITPVPEPIKELSNDPLWHLMQTSYVALNKSKPNLTEDCWLCYNVRPPYYEAIARTDRVQWSNRTNPKECNWEEYRNGSQGITIQQVTGKGRCIGKIPAKYNHLCNRTITDNKIQEQKNKMHKWIVPGEGNKWVCSDTGITPCLSLHIFNTSNFCIQVTIIPRIIYHTSNEVLYYFEHTDENIKRQKREPVTAITLATLLIAGGVGAGTGITSLVKGQAMQRLQEAVNEDIVRMEQSINALATSVKSLSEVVLQNRRGLDLLFLKEGGLCVALKEECCIFADHTGVVLDSMAELRKRLEQRKGELESNRSWYENWFNLSPWLTTLISTLAGPIITIILGLIFGPCILRFVLQFVKKRLEIAKLLVLTSNLKLQTVSPSVSSDEYEEGEV